MIVEEEVYGSGVLAGKTCGIGKIKNRGLWWGGRRKRESVLPP